MELLYYLVPLLILLFLPKAFIQRGAKKAFRKIKGFSPTHEFVSPFGTGIAVDTDSQRIAFWGKNWAIFDCDFKDILSTETVINGESVNKTNRGDQIIRGAVGGLLLGPAGLLIGALTGSKRTEEKISKISIRVNVNDIDNPMHEVVFYEGEKIKKSSFEHEVWAEKADEWIKRINAVIAVSEEKR